MNTPSFSICGNIVLVLINSKRYKYVVDLGAFLHIYPKWRNKKPMSILNWLKNNNSCWRQEGHEWQSPTK